MEDIIRKLRRDNQQLSGDIEKMKEQSVSNELIEEGVEITFLDDKPSYVATIKHRELEKITYAWKLRHALAQAIKDGVDLTYSKLNGICLLYFKIGSLDLTGANLTNADLSDNNLYRVRFKDADLTGAKLDNSIINKNTFFDNGAILQNISFKNVKIREKSTILPKEESAEFIKYKLGN